MITTITKDFNPSISNISYKTYINNFDPSSVTCTEEGCDGTHTKHSTYKRSYYYNNKKYYIYILRIKCKKCNKTHAILPYFLLPYFLTPIIDIINILSLKTKEQYERFYEEYEHVDESRIYYIKRKFFGCSIQDRKGLYQRLISYSSGIIHVIESNFIT